MVHLVQHYITQNQCVMLREGVIIILDGTFGSIIYQTKSMCNTKGRGIIFGGKINYFGNDNPMIIK